MRPLRAATLTAIVIVGLGAPCLARAQLSWNDDRTRELVAAAIQRRSQQLADSGLKDYTARAHGYLTFLAQLGEGFPDPPKVIKSDELMVEVYWGAPDRSKQRVIGRRDTLLLPTDINYHRDHLGVVQGNFRDIIRLGDGDEVRDVPHPLSARGLEIYDYRITDSLAIRGVGQVIDVMEVQVRPKDDARAAAVGAVYIDRASASVVRMTFSFTRAALRDRQLEDVSVILENGLVEGRFWLPRRQEIEIRRTATWLDFPARGIIRGRWEICCVQANVGIPPETFIGSEISELPRAAQRAFRFEGQLMETLPEEVRAFDAEEVRRVQEEARELVRAGALARVRNTTAAARGVSDFVRVDRVEGLALGAGITRRFGAGLSATIGGRYGTADERVKGRITLEWRSASGYSAAITAFDDWREAGDLREVSGLVNSIAAQEFGTDRTDPYGVRGGGVRAARTWPGGTRIEVDVRGERQRPLAVNARPATGRYEPTILADSVRLWRVGLTFEQRRSWGEGRGTVRARLTAAAHRIDREADASRSTYGRYALDVEGAQGAGDTRFAWRTIGAARGGGLASAQDAAFLGGPVSAPGYQFHALTGSWGASQRIEWQVGVPFVSLDLGRFGRVPSRLTLAPFANVAVVGGDGAPDPSGWAAPSAGLGVIALFDLLRVDVARTLRGPPRWAFSVDVTRDLWPIF